MKNAESLEKEGRVLVTGGAGFIGSNLVKALLEKGMYVVVYDDLSTGRAENLPKDVRGRLRITEGDILDREKLREVMEGIEVVFHNAARVTIRDSLDKPFEDAEINVMGTISVIQASIERKVKKLIFASSMAVYGEKEGLSREKDLLKPTTPYGISKRTAEEYCLYASKRHALRTIILRYFNTYGPNQRISPDVGVITTFIDRLLKKESLTVFGGGNQVRDFVHVDDIVRANLLVLEREIEGGIFNIGTGRGISINDLAKYLGKMMDRDIEIRHEGVTKYETRYAVADISRARERLRYSPKVNLEKGIKKMIEWMRDSEAVSPKIIEF